MPLFGSSGGPKIRLTRPMMILAGVFLVLLVVGIVLAVILISNARRPAPVADQPAPAPTVPLQVSEAESPVAVSPAAPSRFSPTTLLIPPTPLPGAPEPATPVPAIVVATPIPPPTMDTGVAVAHESPGGVGGGEAMGGLPEVSSGLPWLIPVGLLLLVAILWWRWRRAQSRP